MRLITLGLLVAALIHSRLAAGSDNFVIFDNDWDSSGGYLGQAAIAPLLASPNVRLLGLTCVTGDNWRDEGMANVLRYLEEIGAPNIPVAGGAVFPLVNTRQRMDAWERDYGFIFWKGAWNGPDRAPEGHPDDPYKVVPPRDGLPRLKPIDEDAAHFMIRQVRLHPHQVTIYEGGPMTTLALAIRIDPGFPTLARQLVFMGGYLVQTGHSDGFHVDFNFLFDPEAAHIVLSAPWARMTSIGDVGDHVRLTKELLRKIHSKPTSAAEYLARNAGGEYPLWEELGATLIADPSLVTKTEELTMDVDIDHGQSYGRAITGPLDAKPPLGVGRVLVVQQVDEPRFLAEYVAAVQSEHLGP